MTKTTNLTDLERAILRCLFSSSAGNGHDFGFTEDLGGIDPRKARGAIGSLVKKGVLEVYPSEVREGVQRTQFTFRDVEAVRRLVGIKVDLDTVRADQSRADGRILATVRCGPGVTMDEAEEALRAGGFPDARAEWKEDRFLFFSIAGDSKRIDYRTGELLDV